MRKKILTAGAVMMLALSATMTSYAANIRYVVNGSTATADEAEEIKAKAEADAKAAEEAAAQAKAEAEAAKALENPNVAKEPGKEVTSTENDPGVWSVENDVYIYRDKITGAPIVGWAESAGNTYYLAEDGSRTIGWIQLEDLWYYLDKDGILKKKWFRDTTREQYYGDPKTGRMWYSCMTPEGFWLDANGHIIQEIQN